MEIDIGLIILTIVIIYISGWYLLMQIKKEKEFKEFKKNLDNYEKKKAGEQKPKIQRRANTRRKNYKKKKVNVQSKS